MSKAKGEIWIYKDSKSGKNRPGLIIGANNTVVEIDITIAKITSQDPRNEYDIVIENWEEIGLNKPSIVRCSKLNTVTKEELIFKAAELTPELLEKVNETIIKYIMN